MGKNHRHSKKLKSERNKVHIKSKTKFLPKGQNVTNTAFKIRPIVLQEQLKDRDGDDLVRKKVNIDELISKLKHFNDTVKTETCKELIDVVTITPVNDIQIYFSSIIHNTSVLIQDREAKVRRAAIKLFRRLFEKVSDNTLRPFFEHILVYLKCAMTNINKHVQEDSLLLLDAMLEHCSVIFADYVDTFFPTFLMLISKLKNQSERTLSVNLESKISSNRWRVKVLARLYGVLQALIRGRSSGVVTNNNFISASAWSTSTIPVYKRCQYSIDVETFSLKRQTETEFDRNLYNVLTLLHEIWMEIMPEKHKKGLPTVLVTEEAVTVFTAVVNIVKLVYEYLRVPTRGILARNKKFMLFLDSLVSSFPYSHTIRNEHVFKDFPKYFDLTNDPNYFRENLVIIHLYVTFEKLAPKVTPRPHSIGLFINKCLTRIILLTPNCYPLLVEILRNLTSDYQNVGDNEELSKSLHSFYENQKVPEKFKLQVLEVLIGNMYDFGETWVERLPSFLYQRRVSARAVEVCLDLCRKGRVDMQEGVRKSLGRILENLPNLEIIDAENPEESWKKLASVFFYLQGLNEQELKEIKKVAQSHPQKNFASHLQSVLDLRRDMLK